ncbi:LAS superfamily LD-carboxypeptidase LdcB [Planomicrobium soli]|uniref:LAS superfamily LD-carboxypeptidase LdcB n=1 Tax=Planomicrobium soli TaxID=1176648 RepID=A0A2P8H3K1_9BACL|nr:D-alanyl-D-alanine carboxypeptidase family protein [Planomicrobium soli]PSL40780.1 LAS superfamily LD-carboxypeptidase LdcB [Planomicrobium soli]
MNIKKWMVVLLISILLAFQLASPTKAKTDTTPPAKPLVAEVFDSSKAITGKAESNAKVYAYAGNKKLGEAVAYNGKFSITIVQQKTGTNISVHVMDAAKNKSKSKTVIVGQTPPAGQYKTTANLNMRSNASINAHIVTVLPKGTVVSFVNSSENWYKIKAGAYTGFVSSAYLQKVFSGKPANFPAPSSKVPGTYVNGVLLVNKKNGLPSSYNPGVDLTAQKAVAAMISAAKKDKIYLTSFSTFRSYSRQSILYSNYVAKYGEAEAEKFSARPGHSEHQTGLAFDFGGAEQADWLKESFGKTEEGKWLQENAHKYGFILRYPKGKESITGYQYEPWHYRYVGSELAVKIKGSGKTLEEYLGVKEK